MKKSTRICLIGDILVDVTLKNTSTNTKLRLGGIIHAARALWALNISFDVGYFAPEYLDGQIKKYLKHLGCINIIKLGNITGAPYVFLIEEVKEIGDQGYEFLLRDELKIKYDIAAITSICKKKYSDYLLISGNYDLIDLVNQLPNNIHLDIANNVGDVAVFSSLLRKVTTLFVSTSSDIFKKRFKKSFEKFAGLFEKYTQQIILKENRGGSRGYHFESKELFSAGMQPRKIVHSVGVGDAFDAAFITATNTRNENLVFASWLAAEYAVTTFPDDFKKGVARLMKSSISDIVKMPGIELNWETRKKINIYIAAPDFSFIDVKPIETLAASLVYHNFTPRRPIKENGQMEDGASKIRRRELFTKDMLILDECSMMIAVLLYNDPGTLLEVGYAAAKGMPVFVYDPYNIATNCMLTELPTLVSNDLDEIITEVFIKSANINTYE